MHKRQKKLFFWIIECIQGIVTALFACIAFRADWFSTWYDRVLHAIIAAFFVFIEIRTIIGSIREVREPDSRIWSPDRSTRKKKRKPKKIFQK